MASKLHFGRQASVSWGGTKSKTRMFPNGVPQGAVLSPTLFNLFMSDLPTPLHPAVSISSYADDLTIVSQHHKVDVAAENLQSYIHQLEDWLDTNRMEVSAHKSSITLLTPHTGEYRLEPAITLRGATVPVSPTTKILGMTLDRGMTFRPHSQEVIARAKPRLNVMKALSSTTFGHQKEAQTALYKQFIRPILEYASPAWCPDLAPSHMSALQRTQNAALRVATGCTRSSSPSPRRIEGATSKGAHRHEGCAILCRGHKPRPPLLPSPQPQDYQQTPSQHSSVELHNPPLLHPPNPVRPQQQRLDTPAKCVQIFRICSTELSSGGVSPPSNLGGGASPIQG